MHTRRNGPIISVGNIWFLIYKLKTIGTILFTRVII